MMSKVIKAMRQPWTESHDSQALQQLGDAAEGRGDQEEVRRFVQDLIDDYTVQWNRSENFEVLNFTDPELAHAHVFLEDRINLDPPPTLH